MIKPEICHIIVWSRRKSELWTNFNLGMDMAQEIDDWLDSQGLVFDIDYRTGTNEDGDYVRFKTPDMAMTFKLIFG